MRSWMGQQERYHLWRPLYPAATQTEGYSLVASMVHRWLDQTGRVTQESVAGQLEGVPSSGTVGVDGLWARLRGGAKSVVLLVVVVDSVHGVIVRLPVRSDPRSRRSLAAGCGGGGASTVAEAVPARQKGWRRGR